MISEVDGRERQLDGGVLYLRYGFQALLWRSAEIELVMAGGFRLELGLGRAKVLVEMPLMM